MAVTINYQTYVINVPKSDTQFVETNVNTGLEVRQIDITIFGKLLADIQDNAPDVWAPTAYSYTQPADIGGTQLAPVLLILAPYTVTFEDDQYAINIVGGNTNLPDFTNVNQVSIRPNNSAGQTFSKQVEDSAFGDNRVWVDMDNGEAGTGYPLGTSARPVNNLQDAQTIIAARNLPKRIHLIGFTATTGTDNFANYDVKGASSKLSGIHFVLNTITTNFLASSMAIGGDLNGNVSATEATSFSNIIDFDGQMILCGLTGNIALGSGGDVDAFIDCFSEQSGSGKPILNCDDLNNLNIHFRRYSGGLEITNYSQVGNNMSLDFNQGSIKIGSTCTEGTIIIRGDIDDIIDESGPNCTVINRTYQKQEQLLTQLDELYKIQGLNAATPMVVTPTTRTAGTINLDLSGDGETITTVTRND